MSNTDDPGGGALVSDPEQSSNVSALPATSVWAKGGNASASGAAKIRSYEEIIADAKTKRNILEIKLKKNIPFDDPSKKPVNLSFDQLSELLFDVLKVKSEECLQLNFFLNLSL